MTDIHLPSWAKVVFAVALTSMFLASCGGSSSSTLTTAGATATDTATGTTTAAAISTRSWKDVAYATTSNSQKQLQQAT